ncbi:TIGR04086 family membrane protein [Chlamydiifrater volucris]|uniref:TIGR04086 family membrane protein n=1 Tax=Chlamydiifrater volucris TaxID=2681470 RepID=UPI001BCC37CF|nr:TIGR04086 family membrane protein [Chlamydiifrater volucris]
MLPSILPGFFFIFYAIVAFFGAYLAIRKGRSPVGWFLGTLFLGFFGIFLLLILPPKIDQEQEDSDTRNDTDFLETLDSSDPENINDDLFLSPDTHFILDKSQKEDVEKPIEEDCWFYLDLNKQAIGPMPRQDLYKKIKTLSPRADDWKKIWVWKKGMKNWKRAEDLKETKE